jgi:hypothetical protein
MLPAETPAVVRRGVSRCRQQLPTPVVDAGELGRRQPHPTSLRGTIVAREPVELLAEEGLQLRCTHWFDSSEFAVALEGPLGVPPLVWLGGGLVSDLEKGPPVPGRPVEPLPRSLRVRELTGLPFLDLDASKTSTDETSRCP